MLRIAHIGSKGIPSRGGTERVVEALAARQAWAHHATVYGSARVCKSGMCQGVRVIAIPAPASKHAGPAYLQLCAALHALAGGQYDVVHLHGSENGFLVPLLRLRYPVVTTNHGPAYEREKWAPIARRLIRANERTSIRWATAATAVAATQAQSLSERFRRPVEHVPNGVDSIDANGSAEALALLEEVGFESRGYVLFAAARVDPTKGCHTLLEACHLAGAPPHVLIVGDLEHARGYETRLRQLAEDLSVAFVPRLDDKAVLMGLLRNCSVFVFPSSVEAMSMMLLEALAVGTVGVASDIPENTAILPASYPTFAAGDANDLRRQLESVLAWDDDRRRSHEDCGREWVHEHYDWDRIAARYEDLYRRAIQR